jgi:quinol-cytochrome oxidoreductase complex cytochrome b subunit
MEVVQAHKEQTQQKPSWEERLFYAELAASTTAVGVGPFMIWDWHHPNIGYSLIAIGALTFVHALVPRADPSKSADVGKRRFFVVVALMCLVWGSIAYDVYDHDTHSSQNRF